MKTILFLALSIFVPALWGQTTLYLRSSGPNIAPVCGTASASGGSATEITTCIPHQLNTGDTMIGVGICAGPTYQSRLNNTWTVTKVDAYNVTVPVAYEGAWCLGTETQNYQVQPNSQYIAKVMPYTLGAEPLGIFDGPDGDLYRRAALTPGHGMATVNGVTTTCASSVCTVTVTMANGYDPLHQSVPLAVDNSFTVTGTGGTVLDVTNGSSCAGSGSPQAPSAYTVASIATVGGVGTSWTSSPFTCAGLPNGTTDWTNYNNTCGSAGNLSCIRVSQLAHNGNPFWAGLVNYSSIDAYAWGFNPISYKFLMDGGTQYPNSEHYEMLDAAVRLILDPSNQLVQQEVAYFYNNMEKQAGVNFSVPAGGSSVLLTQDFSTLLLNAAGLYSAAPWVPATLLSPAQISTGLNKVYNDLYDPTTTACTPNSATSDVVASGNAQGGTATSITLAASDTSGACSSFVAGDYCQNVIVANNQMCLVSSVTVAGSIRTANCAGLWSAPVAGTQYWVLGTVTFSGLNSGNVYGSAQGGSSNTIVLAGSSQQPDGYYTNAKVFLPTLNETGIVTGYVNATNTATIAGSWGSVNPTSGTAYSIVLGAVVTGYNTHFTTSAVVGGGIQQSMYPYFDTNPFTTPMSFPIEITSDTSMKVIVGYNYEGSTTTPEPIFYLPPWSAGNCGIVWGNKGRGGNVIGTIVNLYGPSSNGMLGETTLGISWTGQNGKTVLGPFYGSNFSLGAYLGHLAMGVAAAPADQRAVRDAELAVAGAVDFQFAHYMTYGMGWNHSGTNYGPGVTFLETELVQMIRRAFPSFPSMDETSTDAGGGWLNGFTQFMEFGARPDIQYYAGQGIHAVSPTRWGGGNGDSQVVPGFQALGAYLQNPTFAFKPTSTEAQQTHYWQSSTGTRNMFQWANSSGFTASTFLFVDPRIGSTSGFASQPTQYYFHNNSPSVCQSLTGGTIQSATSYGLCNPLIRGDAIISRNGSWTDTTASLFVYQSRTYALDHDAVYSGMLNYYDAGEIIDTDQNPPGNGSEGYMDNTAQGGMIQYSGLKSFQSQSTLVGSPIIMWAFGNHGGWTTNYGDQNSQYVLACSDLSGAYNINFTGGYAWRCPFQFKMTGGDEIFGEWTATQPASPTQIVTHVHYTQNGETGVSAYPEGSTTCPGPHGCTGLNTDRVMLSLEDGGNDGNGDPTRNYGVVSNFLSPGTILVNHDCGTTQCTPSNTYTDFNGTVGNGHTDRVSIWAGNSVGGAATKLEELTIHKRVNGLTDTSLTTTGAATADGQWFVSQMGGARSCAVLVVPRGGTTHSTMSTFTTSACGGSSSTMQYAIIGVTPGLNYTVSVGGVAVYNGTPASGDSTIYFTAGSGAVTLSTGTRTCTITTGSLPGGTVGTFYSQTVGTANCVAPVTWSIASGSLCAGLSLGSSTGTISGTPTTAQTCNFTVQAVDSVPTTTSQALSITISSGVVAVTIGDGVKSIDGATIH